MVGLQCLGNPGLLVLDDPFIGLDQQNIKSILRLLNYQKQFSCIILITNTLQEIMEVSDKVGILEEGQFQSIYKAKKCMEVFQKGYIVNLEFYRAGEELIQDMADKYYVVCEKMVKPKELEQYFNKLECQYFCRNFQPVKEGGIQLRKILMKKYNYELVQKFQVQFLQKQLKNYVILDVFETQVRVFIDVQYEI